MFQDKSELSTLEDKIDALRLVEHLFPVAIIINDLTKNEIAHMSQYGLDLLAQKAEDVIGLEIETYHARYFNEEDSKFYMPKVYGLIQSETKESVSFFQQVRTSTTSSWDWYLSSLKLFHRDKNGKPVATIATAQKIDPNHYFTSKAESLLNENQFIKLNFNKFSSLTKREKLILKLVNTGMTSPEIAEQLFISVNTVTTHRKNIRKKLSPLHTAEIARFIEAFGI